MEQTIWLDAHAACCMPAVISQTGRSLEECPVETNGQALVEAIRMIPGRKHLVFEEGLERAWLYETLRPHVDEVIVAGVTESRGQKSDKRDAYGLAEKLRTGPLDEQILEAPSGVHAASGALAGAHHGDARPRARTVAPEEPVPFAWGADTGCIGLQPSAARRVEESGSTTVC